jgi:hypothetical protein
MLPGFASVVLEHIHAECPERNGGCPRNLSYQAIDRRNLDGLDV